MPRLYTAVEGVRLAVETLRGNRLRSGLTILGVAVGVFVVVVMAAVVHGVTAGIMSGLEAAGPTTVYLTRAPVGFTVCDGTNATCPWRQWPTLNDEEIARIAQIPSVAAVNATAYFSADVRVGGRVLSSPRLMGVLPAWTDVSGTDVVQGRNFTPADALRHVAIVNETMATSLFDALDPLGRFITIGGSPYQVIGVSREATSFLSGGDRPSAVVPYAMAVRTLGADRKSIFVAIKPRDGMTATDDVIAFLRSERGLRPGTPNTFTLTSNAKILETANKASGVFLLVMVALSAIGLLIGGVGVVAIMLISVTERTREIGIRKALGATRQTILWQFLVEAATLTAIGASVGLAGGWLAVWLVRSVTPLPAVVPLMSIVASLGASVVTGVVCGIIPAMRASAMDPVEALRYE